MKRLIVGLLTLIIFTSSSQIHVYANAELPVARVNGKEIFLEENSYEYLEMRKKDLEDQAKYYDPEQTKLELKSKLQKKLDQEIKIQVDHSVERKLLEQILKDEGFHDNEYEFFQEKFKVTDKSVKEYIEENKEKLKEWTYKGWHSVSKEDMENIKNKLQDKDLLERIIELEKKERGEKRPTLLDEFKRNQIEYELNRDYERLGMSGGSSSGNISALYSELTEDEITMEELSKLETAEFSDVVKIGEDYHIYLLIDEKNLEEEIVEMNLRYKEYRKYLESLLEEADIEYIYPELKIQMDMEETKSVKFANVNGEDLYLEADELDTIGIFDEEDREKRLEEIKENTIRTELIYKAAIDAGFEADGEERIEKWRAVSKYTESLLDGMDITEKEIDEYIKDNGGKIFRISVSTIQYAEPNRYIFENDENIELTEEELNRKNKENANLLYKELKKDDKAYKIARIMADSWDKPYELSEEERELLDRYSSFKDFYIGGESIILNTEMDNEDQYLYDEWEKIKNLKVKSLTKPVEKRDQLNDITNYSSLIILDRTEKIEELKDDIIDLIKFKKLEELTQGIMEKADIKYY